MASNSLLLVVVVSSFGLSAGQFSCDDYYVDGTYCLDDYSGYHACTWKGGWGERYKHDIVKCPPDTQCSCHFRWRCPHDDPSKICLPYTTPKPMVDPAIFTFTGNKTKKYYYRYREDKVTPQSGEIRQDKANNKYMKVYMHCNKKRYFKLVLPRKPFGFEVFFGNYDEKKCRRYVRYSNDYNFFGDDLPRYTLQKSWKDDKRNGTQQSWYFIKGDHESQHFKHYWDVSVVIDGDHIQPEKTVVKYLGDEDHVYTSTTTLKWTTTTRLGEGESTDNWFTKPDFC